MLQLRPLRLDPITILDRTEMLPAVHHQYCEKEDRGDCETAHLPLAHRIVRLDQARIIQTLVEENFWRRPTARPLLCGEQEAVMVHHRFGTPLLTPVPECIDCDACCCHKFPLLAVETAFSKYA